MWIDSPYPLSTKLGIPELQKWRVVTLSHELIFPCCYRNLQLQRCKHAWSLIFSRITSDLGSQSFVEAPRCLGSCSFWHVSPTSPRCCHWHISRWQPPPPHHSLEKGEKGPTHNPSRKFTCHFYSYQIGKNLVALQHLAARKATFSCKVG